MSENNTEQLEQEVVEQPTETEARFRQEPATEKSIRNQLKSNFKEFSKDPAEDPVPLTTKEKREAEKKNPPVEPAPKAPTTELEKTPKEDSPEVSEAKKTTESEPPVQPQATGITAPAALTKEEKAVWDKAPKEIQEAFLRREKDTQKGIDNLKAKYQPIEDALAPVKLLLQQNGLTEGHAVTQLFNWHRALAVPDKAQAANALKALARSHNIDLSLLNPQQQNFAPQNPAQNQPAQQDQQQVDPYQQIENLLEQKLQPVTQRLNSYDSEIQRQRLEAANNELAVFSKDKPHFEKARVKMAEILTTAANFGRPISLQDAYDEAVWSMPEVRGEILQEQQAKQEAEFKATQEMAAQKAAQEAEQKRKEAEVAEAKRKEAEALDRARRASVSPRSTAPVGAVTGSKRPNKPQSVADTINSVMKDLRATV